MLESLHISNYALIDRIDIDFSDGLNIITGETGAGKSIILGALSMLLGGRADMKAIGKIQEKSVIEATFDISGNDAVEKFCIENDIDHNASHCILRRELAVSGRSRSFINDTPATLAQLSQLGLLLIDIHSQHQNQLLTSPEFQLKIIDSLAGKASLLEQYSQAYNQYRAALQKYKVAKTSIQRDSENRDFMEFQLGQLNYLSLNPGELSDLLTRRDQIASDTEIKSYLSEAREALSEGPHNALAQIGKLRDALTELIDVLPQKDDLLSRIDTIDIELDDISQTLSEADARYEYDPSDLEYLEQRISDIQSAMHKYHVDTEEQLISLRDKLQKRINLLDDADNILLQLQNKAKAAKRAAMQLAQSLSMSRSEAALKFADTLQSTAMPLGMKNIVCRIPVVQGDLTPTGIDTVEFLFAFNKNQAPIPVSGAASGGEVSRLMLSIKSIIADKIQLPTIVFDEVDTGVSGDVAQRMGIMMEKMSSRLQVIVITHLPQVAALGKRHFKVFKEDDEFSTHTYIKTLDHTQRIDELALMLSGDSDNKAARTTAESLLKN